LAAAREFQMRLDRTDQEALPIGQRGKLPHRLGLRQRLERWNVLTIRIPLGIRVAGGLRAGRGLQQGRRREAEPEAHAEEPATE
jgi:hypothetical protein